MHAPAAFRVNDTAELAAFIEARHFGTLIVTGPNGPQAAHVPMLVNRDETGNAVSLECHVARSNPVAAIAASGVRALAIFNGADAYVTPSLYLSKREHGRVVPTWNYIAVEVAGDAVTFNDSAQLLAQINRMTDVMEQPTAAPWSVDDAPADYVEKLVGAITGLRLTITSIEGVRKLSQNRAEGDRAGVLNGFTYSSDPSARQLATEMSKEV
ncbi:MAG: FMN-binding negative transcriptional regulator [Hyphomonadaceae bacterium]|nr:FMN-binding negative transcriptional regulator [Hyphomonadaceae bacterium]